MTKRSEQGRAQQLTSQHSKAGYIRTRKTRTRRGLQITIDDPKIFTKPWSQEFEIIAKPEWDKIGLFEYVCDNNRCPGGKCGNQ